MQKLGIIFGLAGLGVACSDVGAISVTATGDGGLRQEIPFQDSADGWGFRFTKFLVALSDVSVADATGLVGGELREQRVFDVAVPGTHPVVRFGDLEAKHWPQVGVTLGRSEGASAGNAADADVELMNHGHFSVYVEGTTMGQGIMKTFRWGFTRAEAYADCGKGGASGIIIPTGGEVELRFVIAGEALFTAGGSDGKVRGQPFAGADQNGDGEITLEELGAVDAAGLPRTTEGVGATPLRQSVESAFDGLVRFQGTGTCRGTARDVPPQEEEGTPS